MLFVSRRAACCLTLAACLAPGSDTAARPQARAWLAHRIKQLAGDKRVSGARVSVLVVPVRGGRPLVAIDADRKVSIASNVKLFTSAAALALLGPQFRFKTAIYVPQRRGSAVEGDIYLKGFGDPTLTARDLWRLAAELRDAGIREVRGGLTLDTSYFDGEPPPLFNTRDNDAYYRPAMSALSLNGNVVAVRVRAGPKAGLPARVAISPPSSYLRLVNKVTTVSRRRRSYLRIRVKSGEDRCVVRVSGRVRRGYRGGWYRKRLAHPDRLAGYTLIDLLKRMGVKVHRRRIQRASVPPKARALAVHKSRPLGELVREMNKVSSNLMAEHLLKTIGAKQRSLPGSSKKGLAAVSEFLAKQVGLRPGSYTMKNGSGLYEASLFSARQVVRLLRHAYLDFRYGPDFVASLSVAGVDGTLSHRFLGSGAERYVRAKTGTLARVVSLSGYVGAKSGRRPHAFSVLVTDFSPDDRVAIAGARAVADEMARAVVSYLER